MTEKIKLARHVIEDALSNAGVWEFSIRKDYSGRFMYGETCLGVTMPWDSKDKFLSALKEILVEAVGYDPKEDDYDEEAEEELEAAERDAELITGKAQTDSMGRDMILYFPGVELEG